VALRGPRRTQGAPRGGIVGAGSFARVPAISEWIERGGATKSIVPRRVLRETRAAPTRRAPVRARAPRRVIDAGRAPCAAPPPLTAQRRSLSWPVFSGLSGGSMSARSL